MTSRPEPLREELARHLARRLDAAFPDVVLLALEIGCGALALGMDRVEPAVEEMPR